MIITKTQFRHTSLGVAVTTCLLLSNSLSTQAMTFGGSSSGEFGLPLTPGFGVDVFLSSAGTGTNNQLNWGQPDQGSVSNFVRFDGGTFVAGTDSPFKVGDLTYRNGATFGGFDGDFPLTVTLNFTTPAGVNQSFSYLFNILNTPNTSGDPIADGDRLQFSTTGLSLSTFNVDGVDYTLQLLGFSTDLGTTIISEFNSLENTTATAGLYGQITAAPIPTPALLPGLIGLGVAALRKRKANSVSLTREGESLGNSR